MNTKELALREQIGKLQEYGLERGLTLMVNTDRSKGQEVYNISILAGFEMSELTGQPARPIWTPLGYVWENSLEPGQTSFSAVSRFKLPGSPYRASKLSDFLTGGKWIVEQWLKVEKEGKAAS
jgi:hypothetical protein